MLICQICGKEFKSASHLRKKHNISAKEYYDTYLNHNEGICYCGKETAFLGLDSGYRRFCSVKCARNNSEVSARINQTTKTNLLEKYGVENVQQIPAVKEKTKQTCLEKYGNEFAIASTSVQNKIRQIQISKHKNYNGLIELSEVGSLYGSGWYQKRKLLGIQTIKKGRYGYIKTEDIQKIIDYKHSLLRHSEKEFLIASYLKDFDFIQNSRKILDNKYELDFFFPDYKVALEYNSNWYHCIQNNCSKDYHLKKSLACREKGIRLIHIYGFEDFDVQLELFKNLLLGQDNYPKNNFNKNNFLDIPEPEIIYDKEVTIYGAGKLY